MKQYKTPNIYIEEIQSFPPSVVSGSTAVPCFIGYTEKLPQKIKSDKGSEYQPTPIKISSMIEYENIFGQAYFSEQLFTINVDKPDGEKVTVHPENLKSLLYYQLQMYFANGGGACYIISVGSYTEALSNENKFVEALKALETEDEPTLIILTDAILGSQYYDNCNNALEQCNKLKDRFTIIDVPLLNTATSSKDSIAKFRNDIGLQYLQFGAAYYPYLNTNLPYFYKDKNILVNSVPLFLNIQDQNNNPAIRITYPKSKDIFSKIGIDLLSHSHEQSTIDLKVIDQTLILSITKGQTLQEIITEFEKRKSEELSSFIFQGLTITNEGSPESQINEKVAPVNFETKTENGKPPLTQHATIDKLKFVYIIQPRFEITHNVDPQNKVSITETFNILSINIPPKANNGATDDYIDVSVKDVMDASAHIQNFDIKELGSSNLKLIFKKGTTPFNLPTLEILKNDRPKIYAEIKNELDKLRVTLPPSGAVAGVYASVDRDRGVWKAPANVSINAITGPTIKITDCEQEDLNITDSGKSINAIRSFTGKGTLVWGSRTLDSNSNEWRYISVRRLFNTIEESIKKSTSFAVFEPNTEMTWLKVRVMIENYLHDLWSQGALAGTKAEDAYFVQVGLNKTMTDQDIKEGRMIVKVGIAAVRPAEFIIIQFSHLLQKS